jgi:hypothetical protein
MTHQPNTPDSLAEGNERTSEASAGRSAREVPDVDALANFIRYIDGTNKMGASTLAEWIVEWMRSSPAALSAPAQEPDLRDAFERIYPMPPDCMRCGDSYAATSFNAWRAHEFIARFDGYRAAFSSASAQPIAPSASQEQAVAAAAFTREALVDLIAEHLTGTYYCNRVWSAWSVGTMGQDDFEDVGESDKPSEIADAIMDLVAPVATAAIVAQAAPVVAHDAKDALRLDFLGQPGIELGEDNNPEVEQGQRWVVDRCQGVRNDREWVELGRGATPREAIDAARAQDKKDRTA